MYSPESVAESAHGMASFRLTGCNVNVNSQYYLFMLIEYACLSVTRAGYDGD
jgi:hypothetical protein